eukprot:TRINITY_DN4769_c0_g1_i4.p1 TRINITY_DN4769_c0_g1~~TRINITY_DN4769_c0_g1_i4.p1  ORF type:complete len:1130 (+),score=356.34 TRINITY_DN4769_c0_g1_i4:25-3390(+)
MQPEEKSGFVWRQEISFIQRTGSVHRNRAVFEIEKPETEENGPSSRIFGLGDSARRSRRPQVMGAPQKDLEAEITTLKESIRSLEAQRDELQEKLNAAQIAEEERERILSLESTLIDEQKKCENDRQVLEEEKSQLQLEKENLLTETEYLNEQKALWEENSQKIEEELDRLEAKRKELEEKERILTEDKMNMDSKIREAVNIEAGKQEGEKERERLAELTLLNTQNQELQKEIQTLTSELASSKRAKSSAEKKISDLKKKLTASETEVQKLKKQNEAEVQKLKKENAALASKNSSLAEEHASKMAKLKESLKLKTEEAFTWKFKYDAFFEDIEKLKNERKAWEELTLTDPPVSHDKLGPPPTVFDTPQQIVAAQQDLAKRTMRLNVIQRYITQERQNYAAIKQQMAEHKETMLQERKKFVEEMARERANLARDLTKSEERTKKAAPRSPRTKKEMSRTTSKRAHTYDPSLEGTGSEEDASLGKPTPKISGSVTERLKRTKSSSSPNNRRSKITKDDSHVDDKKETKEKKAKKEQKEKEPKEQKEQKEQKETVDTGLVFKDLTEFLASDADPWALSVEGAKQMLNSEETQKEMEKLTVSVEGVEEGTPLALVLQLGLSADYVEFAADILMIHEYLIPSPIDLLRVLIVLYNTPEFVPKNFQLCEGEEGDLKQVYKDRLCNVLRLWLQTRYEKLVTTPKWEDMFSKFRSQLSDENHKNLLDQCHEIVTSQFKEFKQFTAQFTAKVEKEADFVSLPLRSIHPQQLARQLTVIEQGHLQAVNLTDFYDKAWNNPDSTPGLTAWINDFTDMTYWIATTIVDAQDENGCRTSAARRDTISFWIQVMNELLSLNNYNSVMQVFSAFSLPSIDDLSEWEAIPKPEMEIVNKVTTRIGTSTDYQQYRQLLDEILSKEQPCIPFLSLMLRDLTFIEKTPTSNGASGYCNFKKLSFLANIFDRLQTLMLILYDIPKDANIQQLLIHKTIFNSEQLSEAASSFVPQVSEPPELTMPIPPLPQVPPLPSPGQKKDASQAPKQVILEKTFQDCLSKPQQLDMFASWLGEKSRIHENALECMLKMITFSRLPPTNPNESRASAKEIWSNYLTPTSPKCIGAISPQILTEIGMNRRE